MASEISEKLEQQINMITGSSDENCPHEEFEKIILARTFYDEYYLLKCKQCGMIIWAKKMTQAEFNKAFLNSRYGMQFENDVKETGDQRLETRDPRRWRDLF